MKGETSKQILKIIYKAQFSNVRLWFSLVRKHLLVCDQHYSRKGCEWIILCCLWKYLIMGKCCFMLLKWCCFKLNYTSFEQAMCWELFVMEENKDSLISFTQNNFWKLIYGGINSTLCLLLLLRKVLWSFKNMIWINLCHIR